MNEKQVVEGGHVNMRSILFLPLEESSVGFVVVARNEGIGIARVIHELIHGSKQWAG